MWHRNQHQTAYLSPELPKLFVENCFFRGPLAVALCSSKHRYHATANRSYIISNSLQHIFIFRALPSKAQQIHMFRCFFKFSLSSGWGTLYNELRICPMSIQKLFSYNQIIHTKCKRVCNDQHSWCQQFKRFIYFTFHLWHRMIYNFLVLFDYFMSNIDLAVV